MCIRMVLTIRLSIVFRALSYERNLFSPFLFFGSAWLNTSYLFCLLPVSISLSTIIVVQKNVQTIFNVKMIYHQRKKVERRAHSNQRVRAITKIEILIEWIESVQTHHTRRPIYNGETSFRARLRTLPITRYNII